MLVLHVVLALSALAVSAYGNVSPSHNKLKTSYTLAVATLVSGSLLIVLNNASILRTCLTGIAFFAVVTALNELARRRLASE